MRVMSAVLAGAAIVAGCGGGSSGIPGPASGTAVTDMAGVYEFVDPTGRALAIVDDQGNIVVTSDSSAFDPTLTLTQFVDFSGVATTAGGTAWLVRDALVYANDRRGPPLAETITTSTANVGGSHEPGRSLALTVTTPPAPNFYRGSFTLAMASTVTRVDMGALAGRYQSQTCQGTPRAPGPCTVETDYMIDTAGHLQGRLTDTCDFTGDVVIGSAANGVLRATGTLSGPGCPGPVTLLADATRFSGPKYTLRWWQVQVSGQVRFWIALQQ